MAVVAATAIGCADPDPVTPPRVAIAAFVGAGANPVSECKLAPGSWLAIGDSTKPVSDGDLQNGAAVHATCAVFPAGEGFNVYGFASLRGAAEGSSRVAISGKLTSSGEQKVEAMFQRGGTGLFSQTDCTVTYETQLQGVAAGRVAGFLRCPKPEEEQYRDCEITAEFKFENCQQ